jgi:hypothetical protein
MVHDPNANGEAPHATGKLKALGLLGPLALV